MKELEEAIRNFKREYEDSKHYESDLIVSLNDAKILLTALENFIPKQELEKDLKILEETEVDNNANFWMKHGIEEYLKKLLERK